MTHAVSCKATTGRCRIIDLSGKQLMERVKGIEPSYAAWEALIVASLRRDSPQVSTLWGSMGVEILCQHTSLILVRV
jgi:hypothetical protein